MQKNHSKQRGKLHHPSRDPSTHRGVITKIYVEIHGPCIYICFLFIGIVRNCDQLEVTCLTCFLVVIPERSRGGHFQRNGVAVLFARNDGVDTGRAANLPCAKTANPTGKMLSGPPIEIASCWWMKHFIDKQFKNHTLLETKTLSLKIEGWNMKFPFWAAISAYSQGLKPPFHGGCSPHNMSDVFVQSSPRVWGYHVPIKRKWRVCLNRW